MADKKFEAKSAKARPAKALEANDANSVKQSEQAQELTSVEETPQLPSPEMIAAEEADKIVDTAAEAATKLNERTTEMQNETTQMMNDRTQAMFGDLNVRAKETMQRSTKIVEEMTDLTRGNVEALVASSKVAARGLETLSQEAAEFSRRSFEEASAAVKNFAEVRSATDFFRLQSEFARTAFDNVVAESSKMSEAMIKLAGDVAEPITSRYSVAAERVKNIAA